MVKVAIIGWSKEAEAIYRIIQQYIGDMEVVAISSSEDAVVERFRRSSAVKIAEHDYRRVLGFHDVDMVYVASGSDTHTAMAIDAMEAGAHVLLGHPITTNAGEAYTIKSKVDHYTTQYGMAILSARHDSTFSKVRQMLTKEVCGRLRSIHVDVVVPYQPPLTSQSLPITAGLYMDELTEAIDLVHFLSDDLFSDVHARGQVSAYDHLRKQKDIDTALISGKLKGGCMVQMSATVNEIPSPLLSVRIVGTDAVVTATDSLWSREVNITDAGSTQIVRVAPTLQPLHKIVLDFRDHILYKRAPEDTLSHSIHAIKVAVAMAKSDILREEIQIDY